MSEAIDIHGVCPRCRKNDGVLNVGRVHFFICHQHKVWWPRGANLFDSWRHEDEETWRENEKLLLTYEGIEPLCREPGIAGAWRRLCATVRCIFRPEKGLVEFYEHEFDEH